MTNFFLHPSRTRKELLILEQGPAYGRCMSTISSFVLYLTLSLDFRDFADAFPSTEVIGNLSSSAFFPRSWLMATTQAPICHPSNLIVSRLISALRLTTAAVNGSTPKIISTTCTSVSYTEALRIGLRSIANATSKAHLPQRMILELLLG